MPKIIETLRQDVRWYGQDGFPYRVAEMELSHIVNVLNWLRRRAHTLRMQHHWDEFLEYSDLDDSDAGPNTERAFIKWLGANPALDVEPTLWLEQMPLVTALKYELILRGSVDGNVVTVHYDKELEDDSDGVDGRAVGADQGLRDRPALG
jgi:hypothetical protein